MPTPTDHLEALLARLRPEDLEGLSPERLKRIGDQLYVAHSWARLAERQAEEPKTGGGGPKP